MSKKEPRSTNNPDSRPQWPAVAGLILLAFALFEIYGPALNGPFLYDDLYLPFLVPGFETKPFFAWISGVRPVLMFTFWLNTHGLGAEPFHLHIVNLILHMAAGVCVWLIARKLVENRILSVFCALVFLLHPLQTESVSYIASRSEVLSGLFFLAGWTAFLYRPSAAIGIPHVIVVLTFYALAVLSKEHAVVLGAVLLLTDYFFNPGFSVAGIRRNWKLYVGMLVAGIGPAFILLRTLRTADSAGFNMADLGVTDYLLTQTRTLWIYARLFFLPVHQNLDYDMPISRSLLDYGAGLCLLTWIILIAIAWKKRKEWRLAVFGFFLFLILLAPTSSILPIRDVIAERRMYLAVFALALFCSDFLQRWKTSPTTLAVLTGVVSVSLMAATYQRNLLWGSAVALWSDTASKSPNKPRPRFQLAYAYYQEGQCAAAASEYAKVAKLEQPTDHLLIDWALAADCAGQSEVARTRLEEAVRLKPSAHAYALLGMVHGKARQYKEALNALAEAERLDPKFALTYTYRGNIYLEQGDPENSLHAFQQALAIDPHIAPALQGLRAARDAKARIDATRH